MKADRTRTGVTIHVTFSEAYALTRTCGSDYEEAMVRLHDALVDIDYSELDIHSIAEDDEDDLDYPSRPR